MTKLNTDDAALYATYKATAPGLDLDFFIAHTRTTTRAMQDECFALKSFTLADGRLKGLTRTEFYRRLRNLQDAWRQASSSNWSKKFVAPLIVSSHKPLTLVQKETAPMTKKTAKATTSKSTTKPAIKLAAKPAAKPAAAPKAAKGAKPAPVPCSKCGRHNHRQPPKNDCQSKTACAARQKKQQAVAVAASA